jgi:hypothetical protein
MAMSMAKDVITSILHFIEDENIENLSGIRLLKYLYNNYFDYITNKKTFYGKSKTRKSKIIYSLIMH